MSKIATNYTVKVDQWEYFPKYQPSGGFGPISKDAVKLPIYSVKWSGSFVRKGRFRHTGPVIQITVSGVTKELLEYHVDTEQVFTNSSVQITNLDKVLGISDDQFQNYDESQRSNVVFQCVSHLFPESESSISKGIDDYRWVVPLRRCLWLKPASHLVLLETSFSRFLLRQIPPDVWNISAYRI